MSDRKYSVHELDDLRQVMENKYLYGSYSPNFVNGGMSRSFREEEKAAVVEQMVRTAMLAGHTADDYRNAYSITKALPGDTKTLVNKGET